MRIGVPAEVKAAEHRVAITPAGVRELSLSGHEVLVESGAGLGSSLDDDDFARAGARIAPDPETAWSEAELVLKVKEPTPAEHRFLRRDLTLFTFLHLAASKELTDALLESGCTAIAYETVRGADRGLPLLAPMSEVAGRMAAQVGAQLLSAPAGGRGVLMGGVSGVMPAHVVVIGAGSAGRNAAWIGAGMEADVTIVDLDVDKLRYIDHIHQGRVRTLSSNRLTLEEQVAAADLVIGAVLIPGARAPVVVTEPMVESMPRHGVLVDISIDQGGCVATSRMTTHDDPTFRVHDVIHYAVSNMPGAMPRTATYGLTNATLPYVVRLADRGVGEVIADERFAAGVNVTGGALTEPGVAEAHGLVHTPLEQAWTPRT
jgi:alanine dehydrogenase